MSEVPTFLQSAGWESPPEGKGRVGNREEPRVKTLVKFMAFGESLVSF